MMGPIEYAMCVRTVALIDADEPGAARVWCWLWSAARALGL